MKKGITAVGITVAVLGVALSVAYATTISGSPSAGNIIGNGAQISWVTDIASDSQVNYGTGEFNLSGYSASRCDQGGNILAHCVNLTGLTANTLYYYKVTSCVSGGGCGESSTYTFTSASGGGGGGGGPPAAPTGFTNGTPTSTTIPLSWNASANATHYNLYREIANSQSWSGLPQQYGTSYTDTGLSPATTYNYKIEACTSGQGCSGEPYTYLMGVSTAAAPDTTAPTTPTGLSATSTSSSQITLYWTASTDNVGVTGYKVFRNGTYLFTVTTTNLTETTLTAATTYSYYIKAVDAAGNESEVSSTVSATTQSSGGGGTDTTAPSTPTGLTTSTVSSSQINLYWTASTDNVGVTGYKVYRGGTQITTVTSPYYNDTGLAASMSYSYTVKAYDAAGNESSLSTAVSGSTSSGGSSGGSGDATAPTTPTGLSATPMSSSQITLYWTASTDNVGVTGYKIYRNGTYLFTVTTTNLTETTLTAATTYLYYISAVDAAGNESTVSSTASATTLASGSGNSQGPTTPTGLVATKDVHNEVDLSWTASTDVDGVAFYHVLRSQNGIWSYVGQSTNTTYIDLTVSPSTAYYYAVKAYDPFGYYSATSTALFLNTPASSGESTTSSFPSSPSNFGAYFVPNGLYGSSTNLGWSDVSNETSYKVYERLQGGASWILAKIRTSLTGLVDAIYAANTVSVQVRSYSTGTYDYKVSACNSYGCSDSYWVSVAMGGTANTTTSTTTTSMWTQIAPSSLRLGGTPSASGIPLAWNDNSTNEDKFNIERQISGGNFVGAFLAQLGANVTSYTDTTASAGVYYDYRVQACRSGEGCTDYAYLSGVSTSGMASTTTTTTTTSGSIPNAPSNFRLAGTPTSSSMPLAWNDNSTIETKFNLERKLSKNYDYTGSFFIQLGANVTSYTDTTVSYGYDYDYRIQACRSGYGCSAYAYMSGVTTMPGTTNTASSTSGGAAVSVIRGSAYCDGTTGKTSFTLSVTPYGAAFFKITTFSPTALSTIVMPGTYSLPNGSHRWEAFPYSGFTLSGKTNEDFTLNQYCSSVTSTTTTNVTTTTTELYKTPTFVPYIVLNGDAVVHVPYGGVYSEMGAKGYLYPDAAGIEPKRILGKLDTLVPGTYVITYQLLNSAGSAVASITRTVIVDSAPIIKTEPTPFVAVTSAEAIITQEQYANYCDDPKHELECQSYANQKVVTQETTSPALGITQEQFTAVPVAEVFHEESLPSTITDAKQLNAVCSQSAYVETCTGFLVDQGVLSKEEAASQVKQVFAEAQAVTQIFTERTGARAYEDTDEDGITNYDEVNIYQTDPQKADTNGDGVKDGEQLLLGENPVAPKPVSGTAVPGVPPSPAPEVPVITVLDKKVAYEDPRYSGNVKKEIFVAPTIKSEPIVPPKDAGVTAPTQAKITVGGKALPNSFVTIYIFSEPIVVTIKADASGDWTYTLDKELPDGSHEVYSAITDAGGRILAKSEPLPFVKTAAAVSLGSPLLAPPQNQAPGFFSGGSLYALIVVIIGVLGLAISLVGYIVGRNKEGGGGTPPTSVA